MAAETPQSDTPEEPAPKAGATGIAEARALLLQSTEIEDLLLASAHNWAVERSLTHAALNLQDPVSDRDRQGIEQHRNLGDSAFEQALADLREFLGDAPQNAMAENAEDRFERLQVLREQVIDK
jgi:hypothetical protein